MRGITGMGWLVLVCRMKIERKKSFEKTSPIHFTILPTFSIYFFSKYKLREPNLNLNPSFQGSVNYGPLVACVLKVEHSHAH